MSPWHWLLETIALKICMCLRCFFSLVSTFIGRSSAYFSKLQSNSSQTNIQKFINTRSYANALFLPSMQSFSFFFFAIAVFHAVYGSDHCYSFDKHMSRSHVLRIDIGIYRGSMIYELFHQAAMHVLRSVMLRIIRISIFNLLLHFFFIAKCITVRTRKQ